MQWKDHDEANDEKKWKSSAWQANAGEGLAERES